MPRLPRNLQVGFSYHITTRCNNREFNLAQQECREIFLYVIKKAIDKYGFKLYAVCIMSNHVHYLIEPAQPEHLPKIMHFLNWYSAMCFNRMLNRTGHFWEKRYWSQGFPSSDINRALNTLRYIHANPKAASIKQGFFYDFSNYGSYDRLTDDGLSQWHPAFLSLGKSLDECAKKYRGFCQRYKPKIKTARTSTWGSKLLAGKKLSRKLHYRDKSSPGQLDIWQCQVSEPKPDLTRVAKKFVRANRAMVAA